MPLIDKYLLRLDPTFKFAAVLIVMGACAPVGVARADMPPMPAALAAVAPAMECSALKDVDVSRAVGAPTRVDSATVVTDGKPAPYCRVLGEIAPHVKIEVRLPTSGWTQRYVQTGCGGLCGNLNVRLSNASSCVPAQKGELALASTDMGHTGGFEGKWAETDYSARIDYAYRGEHVTALAAKAIIEKYYGQKAKYSYFAGCSDGGREALMEAQRYPQDFNGITAGAAAMNFTTQNTFYHGWNARMNTDSSGHAVLTGEKLPILHAAVVQQCDAADGLKDGLISDPLSCHPDLSVVQCRAGQDPATCLTAEQVKVAKDIYQGAHDSDGNQLVISGPFPGSELNWAGVYVPPVGQGLDRTMSGMAAQGTIKYVASDPNPPESYTLADFKFDRQTFEAVTRFHGLYDSTDPDLSAFAAAGGKLILWHGLADPHISPLNTLAYYGAMQRLMGTAKVGQFTRVFLLPGVGHCGGGEGPSDIDLMTAIMGWVEQRHAPEVLIASHSSGGQRPGAAPGPGAAAAKVDRTRPIYAYPKVAQYVGKGSIDEAANFVAASPAKPWPTTFNWLGASFYSAHYELQCTATGAHFNCKKSP